MATKPTVSASASKKGSGSYGDLETISIDKAKNGFIVTERRASKPQKSGEPYNYVEPEKFAFSSADEAIAHVTKCIGGKKE